MSTVTEPSYRKRVGYQAGLLGGFDQFTGATITPRAVVKAVKEGLEFFRAHRDTVLASALIQQTPDDRALEVSDEL